jgi:hypothetical protein
MWNVEAFFETPGVGGAVAASIIVILALCYGLTIRWISRGREDSGGEQ